MPSPHAMRPDENLHGSDGDDALRGGRGDDLIRGGPGDDLLIGGAGDNTLKGGGGEDTASWFDRKPPDVPGDAPGVLLNLSGQPVRWGYEDPPVAVDFVVLPGTAARPTDGRGIEVDVLQGIERFEGSSRGGDVAVLDARFEEGGTDAAGWTAYSDGAETVWLREFETVLFA